MQLRATPERDPGSVAALLHDPRATTRAAQALRCLPFRRGFYEEVAERALSSGELCRRNDALSLCTKAMAPERVEAHWIWLIQLGVLRREVDGQGLTHRVRLTPMGRAVLGQWPSEIPRASVPERLRHLISRHRPRL
jgi:hypothetical protein